MRILCKLNWHKYKAHYKKVPEFQEEILMPIIPSLFAGPPFLQGTGIFIPSTYKYLYSKCKHCGKRY